MLSGITVKGSTIRMAASDADFDYRSRRRRTMTDKGLELFLSSVNKFNRTLSGISKDINDSIIIITSGEWGHYTLQRTFQLLRNSVQSYKETSDDFIEFLNRSQSHEAQYELAGHTLIRNSVLYEAEKVLKNFETTKSYKSHRTVSENEHPISQHAESQQSPSRHSESRHSTSQSSSTRNSVISQRAKAEAARKRLEFTERESKLMTDKARYEANILLQKAQFEIQENQLRAQKEVAIAEAELLAIESSSRHSKEACSHDNTDVSVKQDRLRHYINDQNQILSKTRRNVQSDNHENIPENDRIGTQNIDVTPEEYPESSGLSAECRQLPTEGIGMNLTKYMIKRDLLASRFYRFDDRPENYVAWKDTFKCIMQEIEATSSDELDLLLKWTGVESQKQVKSIKVSNAGNPSRAIERAWERLDSRYGAPEKVEHALKRKLNAVPKITYKDKGKMYELSDILSEIRAIKEKPKYSALLSFYDTAGGVNPTILKLPPGIQNKWRDRASTYKRRNCVLFPPFSFFCDFIQDMAELANDPSFEFETHAVGSDTRNRPVGQAVSVRKTDVDNENSGLKCVIHKSNHSLNDCYTFKSKSVSDRLALLKQNGICFRCCAGKHLRSDCTKNIKCFKCDSTSHTTAMHVSGNREANNTARNRGNTSQNRVANNGRQNDEHVESNNTSRDHGDLRQEGILHYGGENASHGINVSSACTEICKNELGKSCAKIVLVELSHDEKPHLCKRVYAIIDEQSNSSLVDGEILDYFGIETTPEQYSLSSCSGKVTMTGRRANGFKVKSLDGGEQLPLPVLIECDMIPNNRNEIPIPEVALHNNHLKDIAECIPSLDSEAKISLLTGRDLMSAHHVIDQRIGLPEQPFAQRLLLGWVIIGESCLDGAHVPRHINTFKTYIQPNGRTGLTQPCSNQFYVKDKFNSEERLFITTEEDNEPTLSVEDQRFLKLMDNEMHNDDHNKWTAPLPFKPGRETLPNNRYQAENRTKSFAASLKKDTVKRQHVLDFMAALFENGHAELAPVLQPDCECWYLPLFGIYHPKKKDKIRIVFDSSAKFQGVSLNDVLMSGPNLVNSLLGVLLRFRIGQVGVISDIQQMFYSFFVCQDHRDLLRFVWHRDNNLEKELVDYRMKVHVFGNSPSPAVAAYGLLKTACMSEQTFGTGVRDYISNNFYVDDALSSHDTSEEAVDLLKQTQEALQTIGNLRLHKICSNSSEVLSAFDKNDLAKEFKELDFDENSLPMQRTLGVSWNLNSDTFTFSVDLDEKPYTRRGVLSIINGLYDPLGFASPVTIAGKLLLREAMTEQLDWDQPLSDEFCLKFETWKNSISVLGDMQIPRTYSDSYMKDIEYQDLLLFSDASEKAVAAAAYIKSVDKQGNEQLRFVMGKSKVAPKTGHTIPRLELCAAVLAVELFVTIRKELNLTFRETSFFTDSKVTLGYIRNETKRFYIYVRNRVDQIRKFTEPSQWMYVPTSWNPADDATRAVKASDLPDSKWLKGPPISVLEHISSESSQPSLPSLDDDTEVRVTKTIVSNSLGCERFQRFSTWKGLVRAIRLLKNFVRSRNKTSSLPVTLEESEQWILQCVQQEAYGEDISILKGNKPLRKSSTLLSLSPFLDNKGFLRVGGRLNRLHSSNFENNPIIVPKHHVALLLVRHYHERVHHQGRQFTESAVRNAGLWLIGGKRVITSCIFNCVTCKRLRGKQEYQRMADLPCDRLEPAPSFSYIGIDVFGPWSVSTRRTRGGQANSKRWAVIFTCLVVRAVHIELIDEMSSSSFINALRRFCGIRGEVRIIRSDCGTNFVGSVKDLKANVISIEDRPVKEYLSEHKINWIFNPPHSSHMGGVWERLIGVTRRILDAMLLGVKHLTHDVLNTLMAEISSIINARPLVPISSDPDMPIPLTPATLLTQKTDHLVRCFDLQEFDYKDLHKKQWRCVQHLANTFWIRWKNEYLPTLQIRQKWPHERKNVQVGNVVLVREASSHRNDWPIGVIDTVYPGEDGCVRKVDVRIGKDRKVFTRPVNDIVILLSE